MLGIIIGVAAVILLVALGNGIQAGFNEQFGSLSTQITVTQSQGAVPGGGQARDLTDSDMEALHDPTRRAGHRIGDPGGERGRAAQGARAAVPHVGHRHRRPTT